MVMSPNPDAEFTAQAPQDNDMSPDYNWQPATQGYEVSPADMGADGAPYQSQPPAHSVQSQPGGFSREPQAVGICQPEDTGNKQGLMD